MASLPVELGDIHDAEQVAVASFPGEIREDDVEKQAPAKDDVAVTCTVCNDLRVAAEVQHGNGWQIIYPKAQLNLAVDSMDAQPQLLVRLHDDPKVCGMCIAVHGSTTASKQFWGLWRSGYKLRSRRGSCS